MLSYWPFWLFIAGLVVVGGGVFTWAWRTREIAPSHGSPGRRQQVARRSARAAQMRAWVRYISTPLRRAWIWVGIQRHRRHRPPLDRPQLVQAAPELDHDPGEDGPDDPAWVRQLRKRVEDPNDHLQRSWPEGSDTGTWRREMLGKMERDGQLPDSFMGQTQPEDGHETH